MKLAPILLITAALGSPLANTIQLPDLPDGNYLISIGDDGKPTWTKIVANVTDAPAPVIPKRDTTSTSAPLGKRFNWPSRTYPWCPGGDWFLQRDFYDHGWGAFYAMCDEAGDHWIPKYRSIATYQGTSVTYMCTFSTSAPCRTDEWVDAVNWVSNNCYGRSNGWMEPGYLDVPEWHKRYGYAKVGASICGF